MCLAESGVLTEVEGTGVTRVGTLLTDQGTMKVALTYLPEAVEGDHILFHSGIGFRVVAASAAAMNPESR